MITDRDRINFLQICADEGKIACLNPAENIREQIDKEMAETGDYEFPDIYCKCGVGYIHWDFDDLECVRSTPRKWNPGSQSHSWTSYYVCTGCGEEIEIEEGD